MISTASQADALSLTDGHAHDYAQFSGLTLDIAGRVQGDAQLGGLRVTLPKMFKHLVVYAEGSGTQGEVSGLAITSDVDYSGSTEGIGLYFTGLPDWSGFSTTLRLGYTREENSVESLLSVRGRQATVDTERRNVSARVLFSPLKPIHENGLNGYLAFGIASSRTRQEVLVDQQTEPALGEQDSTMEGYIATGIVYPLGRLRFYAVAEFQQEVSINAGIRWYVSKLPPR